MFEIPVTSLIPSHCIVGSKISDTISRGGLCVCVCAKSFEVRGAVNIATDRIQNHKPFIAVTFALIA
jgi:hypothetical protein